MKKFMKFCGITASIMLIVGLAVGIIVTITNGSDYMNDYIVGATDGSFFEWAKKYTDNFVGYDIADASMFEEDYPVESGDVEYSFPGGEITGLKVGVGGCAFQIEESEDGGFAVKAENVGKMQAYQENGTICVYATHDAKVWDDIVGQIILYVPAGYSFQTAGINLGAGQVRIESLNAQETELEVGAGQIQIDSLSGSALEIHAGAGEVIIENAQITSLEASAEAGHVAVNGKVSGDIDVDCSVGSVELCLSGQETDYNYKLSCMAGSIRVGEQKQFGMVMEDKLENGATYTVDLECAVGNIQVTFETIEK